MRILDNQLPLADFPNLGSFELGVISVLLASLLVVTLLLLSARRVERRARQAQGALEEEIRRRSTIEHALRESEEHFRTLFENAPIMIATYDAQGRFLFWNAQCERELGWTQAEVSAHPEPLLLFYPDPTTARSVHEAIRDKADGLFRERHVRAKHGEARVQLWATFRQPDGNRIAMGIDVTRFRKTQQALEESEERYRLLFSGMLSGFALHEIICDAVGSPVDYRFLEINDAFEKLTGLRRGAVVGRTVREVLPGIEDSWIQRYGRVALTGEPACFEDFSAALGRYYEITAYSPERGKFAVIFNDITDKRRAEDAQKRLETQMQQAQKLESLGVLAGGVAHDFNNLLMGILGNANLVKEGLPANSDAYLGLTEIEGAAKRAADLCRQLLAYSGKGRFVVEPIDVNITVREIAALLHVSISKKAMLRYHFVDNLPAIDVDATQIRQVIMNLIINASEAMQERSGVISVATGAADCDRERLARSTLGMELAPGCYVYVEVADTGCGMDARTQERIFEPFYSTKFTGRGLGLAAVLGIVRGHHGCIELKSAPGRGTTFRVLFPASTKAARPLTVHPGKTAEWRGSGCVLVVDDDETVRTVARGMLERMGFRVLTAVDGREAVAMFKENGPEVHCVLLDLTMPHLNGEETFAAMNRLRPQVPIVISSGYSEDDVAQRFAGRGIAGVLEKPYAFTALIEKMRDVLQRGDGTTAAGP